MEWIIDLNRVFYLTNKFVESNFMELEPRKVMSAEMNMFL